MDGTQNILIVIPTHGHFDYAARAVESALKNTRTLRPVVRVVDDATPDYLPQYDAHLARFAYPNTPPGVFHFNRFPENGGLTRSWNTGLRLAVQPDGETAWCEYACVTNSDVVFAPDWDEQIVEGLKKYALVGPVTNAPGDSPDQYVGKYSILYSKASPVSRINEVQAELLLAQAKRFKETHLNGFCLVAKTATWFSNAYDAEYVFRPRNDFNSKGVRNPTPLMTLNEDELQGRWRDRGLKTAACIGSYVFHYRAVSRGDAHRRGDWVRAGV